MNKMLKICATVLSLVFVANCAFAAKEGGYAGADIGYGKIQSSSGVDLKLSGADNGLAGGIFAGYNFNQYIGLETNYTHYATQSLKGSFYTSYALSNTTITFNNNYKVDKNLNTLDVVAKAYLPISDSGFNLYALVGPSLARYSTDVKVNANLNTPFETSSSSNSFAQGIRPAYGVGMSYDVPNSPVTSSLEFKRIEGRGNISYNSKAIPSANLAAFRVAYNFN